jgi:hypothetical protein
MFVLSKLRHRVESEAICERKVVSERKKENTERGWGKVTAHRSISFTNTSISIQRPAVCIIYVAARINALQI